MKHIGKVANTVQARLGFENKLRISSEEKKKCFTFVLQLCKHRIIVKANTRSKIEQGEHSLKKSKQTLQ